MHPNVKEQLEGMCRILETAIAPELGHAHSQETLRSLIANVRMLSRAWHQLLPFLHWDNDAMGALLMAARDHAAPALRTRLDAALQAAPIEAADALAAEARNEQLRALLCECLDGPPALRAAVSAHLTERSRRFPLRLTGAVPKHTA